MRLKTLAHKQMIQGLPIALRQVIADNTSGNLLNEIKQIMYFLYLLKKLLKKYAAQYNEFNKFLK